MILKKIKSMNVVNVSLEVCFWSLMKKPEVLDLVD